jgi:hypothetical protein
VSAHREGDQIYICDFLSATPAGSTASLSSATGPKYIHIPPHVSHTDTESSDNDPQSKTEIRNLPDTKLGTPELEHVQKKVRGHSLVPHPNSPTAPSPQSTSTVATSPKHANSLTTSLDEDDSDTATCHSDFSSPESGIEYHELSELDSDYTDTYEPDSEESDSAEGEDVSMR